MARPAAVAIDAALFEAVCRALPDAVVVVDEAGRAVFVNAAARRLAGVAEPQPADAVLGALRGAARFQSASQPLTGRGSLLVFRDAASPEGLRAELESLISTTAHDLQEPARKIAAFGDLLRSALGGGLGEREREFLDRMIDAAGRMKRLIDDMQELSRVSTAGAEFGVVPLEEALREALEELAPAVRESGAEVSVSPLPPARADRRQAKALFRHLVSNALRFRRPGSAPRVKVTGRLEDGEAVVSVADDGIGFDAAHRKEIFEPFRRLHGRSEFEGSGLGLAVCAAIVRRHGGRIEADGAPGRGATFTFRLPAAGGTA